MLNHSGGLLMNNFYENLVKVYELLNKGVDIEHILDLIFDSFKEYLPYNRIGLALLDLNGLIYSYALSSDNKPLLNIGYSKNIIESSLNDVVLSKQPRIINDYNDYIVENPNSGSTKLMIKEGLLSSIAYPLITNEECIGVIIFSSSISNAFNESHLHYVKILSENISIGLERKLFAEDIILASITGFAKLVEAKDCEIGTHLERMQSYSKLIAKSLSTSKKYKDIISFRYLDNIYKFSPLHDIGKVGIADGILLKPGKLSKEEFEVMKMHTTIGADILKKSNYSKFGKERHFFDMGIQIALSHHERYNGKGYPYGLSGKNIPLAARIVIVADVLDALTSKRVYKHAFDIDSSLQFIKDESGQMFDPDIVRSLFDIQHEILEVYEQYKEKIDLSNI
jgi:HD-GYP domain-containing protein (c-di-GMP phosphodiesterase class II)